MASSTWPSPPEATFLVLLCPRKRKFRRITTKRRIGHVFQSNDASWIRSKVGRAFLGVRPRGSRRCLSGARRTGARRRAKARRQRQALRRKGIHHSAHRSQRLDLHRRTRRALARRQIRRRKNSHHRNAHQDGHGRRQSRRRSRRRHHGQHSSTHRLSRQARLLRRNEFRLQNIFSKRRSRPHHRRRRRPSRRIARGNQLHRRGCQEGGIVRCRSKSNQIAELFSACSVPCRPRCSVPSRHSPRRRVQLPP